MSGRSPRWIEKPVGFAGWSWAQIIAACQSKQIPQEWKVHDWKNMTINGAEYRIDIIGMNHDDYADGSGKAPLTLQLHDCYAAGRYGITGGSAWIDMTTRSIRISRRGRLPGTRSTSHITGHRARRHGSLSIRRARTIFTRRENGQCRAESSPKLTRTQHIVSRSIRRHGM